MKATMRTALDDCRLAPAFGQCRRIRACGGCAALALWMGLQAPAAEAQYPAKQIRLLVPNAPGGAADSTGRLFGAALAAAVGRHVIIDNRAGAGGKPLPQAGLRP
jgi:tripartite-type tricarboxylate transporter receptor subunit TctC